MKSNLYIVTGGSSGFGKAIAKELLKKNQKVVCISRPQFDLSKPFQAKIEKFFKKIDLKNIDSITLINNAGVVDPVDQIENLKEDEILRHFKINLVAPIVMTQVFLKVFKKIKNKTIVQITSGAATRPVAGWASYCASKAGLNMFNEVLALNKNITAIGYSPGIMDTKMQARIRSRSKKQFPRSAEFKKYKTEKQLRAPKLVAQDLLRLLESKKNKSGQVYRVSL